MEKEHEENVEPIFKNNEKKKDKGLVTCIIVLAILTIGGVAFGIYGMISQNNKITSLETDLANCAAANDDTENIMVTCPDGTGIVVTTTNMANEYKEVVDTLETLTSNIDVYAYIEDSDILAYKPDGINAFVPIKLSLRKTSVYGLGVKEKMSTLETNLANAGFSSIGDIPIRGSAGPQINGYLNPETNTICGAISSANYEYDTERDYISIECAKTSWTWLTEEDKATIKAFETAYYNTTNSYPFIMYDWDNEITNSEYAPYQNTWIGIGGAAGLFYRTSPEAEWQFFIATQGELGCNNFNTEDLKKAYLNTSCWDNGPSTVQL